MSYFSRLYLDQPPTQVDPTRADMLTDADKLKIHAEAQAAGDWAYDFVSLNGGLGPDAADAYHRMYALTRMEAGDPIPCHCAFCETARKELI